MRRAEKRWGLIVVFVSVVFASAFSARAGMIYCEDFSGQGGQGVTGSVTDVTDVDWTIDITGADLQSSTDWFAVQDRDGNELLEGRDLNGNAIWMSPRIDVGGYEALELSLLARGQGNFEPLSYSVPDYYEVSYRLDDNDPVKVFSWSGESGEDTASLDQTVASPVPTGQSLWLQVEMQNNAGTEYFRLDDVQVTGAGDVVAPEPAGATLLLLALLPLLGLRKRTR
jgi:hypothetical protein